MNTTKSTYSVAELRDTLRPIFESAPVYKAVLFGSYARGEANENSDIDILIDSRGELIGIDFYGVLENIVTALDKDVDLFEFCEVQRSPILADINSQGVVLYER
ncbi:MAG: nucleotidyltransferase domain-containing protein [Oscillospiraceae bacterium]|nr:nucleotidyltransferase domain-containing protein [Oscillospiraceae bacterium]